MPEQEDIDVIEQRIDVTEHLNALLEHIEKYVDELETMGSAAMKVYEICLTGEVPSDSLEELRQCFIKIGWLDHDEKEW